MSGQLCLPRRPDPRFLQWLVFVSFPTAWITAAADVPTLCVPSLDWGLQESYRVIFSIVLGAGIATGLYRAARHYPFRAPARSLLVLFAASLILHASAVLTLLRDPTRMPGGFAGPAVFAVPVGLAALLLPYVSTFALGHFTVRALALARSWRARPAILLQLGVVAYSFWLAPWVLDIILD